MVGAMAFTVATILLCVIGLWVVVRRNATEPGRPFLPASTWQAAAIMAACVVVAAWFVARITG